MSSKEEVHIRRAMESDVSFLTHCNMELARETENKILDETTLSEGVQNLLQQQQYGFYLIAEKEGQSAGCLMITYEWSDWRNGLFWWIQSVYVQQEFRRQGIYRSLYTYVQSQVSKDPLIAGIRLYVEKENLTAQNTYSSLGMDQAPYQIYEKI